ncbi:MAG TPA: metal-dependent hydrolase [Candidatus Limnocylindria bacterium]|nr:metal-dependent hydrolase [Candidatus Limnocylindria bacterium]
MLPPGHIAAGYLTGYALLKFAHPNISPAEAQQLLLWTTFFGFAPDLDSFYAFYKQGSMRAAANPNVNHRKFLSHAPVLWLIAGLLIYFFAPSVYIKYIGLALWLGSWSHFLLDSIEYGIMWFWPFSNKVYALKNREISYRLDEKNFFKHNWQVVVLYSKHLSFYLEILVVLSALIVFFHH